MHSCELITNLRAKKVLCHRIEVARISGATTTDCVFCNVIGYRRIPPGKALSNQLNEDRGIGRRSPDPFSLERGRGLGTRLVPNRNHIDITGKCNVRILNPNTCTSTKKANGFKMEAQNFEMFDPWAYLHYYEEVNV